MAVSIRALMLLLALAVGTDLSAQVCVGGPSRDHGPFQLEAAYSSANGTSTMQVGANRLGQRAFGGAFIGSASYDDLDGSTTIFGGSAGYRVPVGQASRTELCPTVGFGLGTGPNDIEGSGVDVATNTMNVGVSIGRSVSTGGGVALIPFASAGLARTALKFSFDGDSETISESYGMIGLGVGLLVSNKFAIRPSIAIPVGQEEDSDPVVSIGVVLAFGGKR
jgi:hypothetical protein